MSFYDESRSPWQNYRRAGAELERNLYAWGSQTFANSYAQGGNTWKIFAPAGVKGYSRAAVGSTEYNRRLEEIRRFSNEGQVKNIDKLLEESRAGKLAKKAPAGFVGKWFGRAVGAAFIGMPLFTTEGGWKEKGVATAAGAAGYAAFHSAGLAGASIGVAIGSLVPIPVLGTVVGAVAGYAAGALGGSMAVEGMVHGSFGLLDKAATKNRNLRKSNWAGDTSAFNTQQAYTMRAASLQMMNTGLLTARSGLGHEGVMLHQ